MYMQCSREQWLAIHSIVNGIIAADCLFDDDAPASNEEYRKLLIGKIAEKVDRPQLENSLAILEDVLKMFPKR